MREELLLVDGPPELELLLNALLDETDDELEVTGAPEELLNELLELPAADELLGHHIPELELELDPAELLDDRSLG